MTFFARRPRSLFVIWCNLLLGAAGLFAAAGAASSQNAHAPLTPREVELNVQSFEFVWTTIRDTYWDASFGGLNWTAIRDELRPQIEKAHSKESARAIMRDLLGRLGKSHFEIIPSDLYSDLDARPDEQDSGHADGTAGLDVRVIEGHAVVTSIEEGSAAGTKGVRPGWEILSIDGKEVGTSLRKIAELYKGSTTRELYLSRSILRRLQGAAGSTVRIEFLDGGNTRVEKELAQVKPFGNPSHFGYLPTMYVWSRTRQLRDNIGYVTFNYFLDPVRLMPMFGDFVQSCKACTGIVIDLRGNPGGIGVMAMGMAGWFIDKSDQRLGTMYTRQTPLKFVVNPRYPTYHGPLAILLDETSGSTSEVFAGGMKDLGRARIFGTRTAGAALPSTIERLPNGDGFQHAMANYVSEGGKSLEGIGVLPDVEIKLTREALLAGRDPVLEAAIEWIHAQK